MHIKFKKDKSNDFYPALKKEVREYIDAHRDAPSFEPAGKVLLFGGIYLWALWHWLFAERIVSVYIAAAVLGVTGAFIVLNIIHEASHGILFRSKRLNILSLGWMSLLGADPGIWKRRHVTYHHAYPNIEGYDADLRQNPLIRITPWSRFRDWHFYQKFYMPFIYAIFSLYWLVVRDFQDTFFRKDFHMGFWRKMWVVIHKVAYISLMLILPIYLKPEWTYAYLFAFLLLHICLSFTAILALASTHANEDSEFPLPDANGNISYSWAEHQVRVTQDFETDNRIVNYFFGGFNHHIAHHLFPGIPCRFYPAITKITKRHILKAGLTYREKRIGRALISHFILIIRNSRPVDVIDI